MEKARNQCHRHIVPKSHGLFPAAARQEAIQIIARRFVKFPGKPAPVKCVREITTETQMMSLLRITAKNTNDVFLGTITETEMMYLLATTEARGVFACSSHRMTSDVWGCFK